VHIRTGVPWISLLLAAALLVSPVGYQLLRDAFFAGEQLTRSIVQPIVFTGFAIIAGVIALEWLVRLFILKRRARGATT
jgi:hypothetical protein